MSNKENLGEGLASFLNTNTKSANSEREAITYIDIDLLDPNPMNFYGMRDIDKLAALISASGRIEPLTVVPSTENEGHYLIIAGHRRRAAVKKLLENNEGEYKERELPCIVRPNSEMEFESEDGTVTKFNSDEVNLLHLIASNRGQRDQRTNDEIIQEIKLLEPFAKAIYEQKKKEGFKGYFRTFFAESILNISKSTLGRLNSFEKASAKVRDACDKGIISESVVIELSSLPEEEQDNYLDMMLAEGKDIRAIDVREYKEKLVLAQNGDASDANDEESEEASSDYESGSEGYSDDDEDDDGDLAIGMDDDSARNVPDYSDDEVEQGFSDPPEKPAKPAKSELDFKQSVGAFLMDVPDNDFGDPKKEANIWIDNTVLDLMEIARQEAIRNSETVEDMRKAAQWGLRAAELQMRIVDFKEAMKARASEN